MSIALKCLFVLFLLSVALGQILCRKAKQNTRLHSFGIASMLISAICLVAIAVCKIIAGMPLFW